MLTTTRSHPVFVHGRIAKAPPPLVLRAGCLSMQFFPSLAFLRTIQLDRSDGSRQEVLRGSYVAVRDHDWDTFANDTRLLQVDTSENGFTLTFQTRSWGATGVLQWQGTITASANGTVRYEVTGKILEPFQRNRIGFCILHPSELAGHPCEIQTVVPVATENGSGLENDGTNEREASESETSNDHWWPKQFPTAIAPRQPMKNLRAIRYDLADGLRAEIRMEGDTFEMEDQRNWTDASFKTYCTPLELPFPVEVKAGEVIRQSVTVKIHGLHSTTSPAPLSALARLDRTRLDRTRLDRTRLDRTRLDRPAPQPGSHLHGPRERLQEIRRLTLNPVKRLPIPALGLAQSSSTQELSGQELERLRRLRLAHLRVDLQLAREDWPDAWNRAATVARQIGIGLEVAIFVTDQAEHELDHFRKHLVSWKDPPEMPVAAWLIFHDREKSTRARWITLARQYLAPLYPEAQFASGTNMYFAELNRQPPPAELLDAVCYSINPQVHAEDNQSLVETLPIQAATVENARSLSGGLPVRVTPVTFRPRFNPNATSQQPKPATGGLPEQVDPRQLSLMGAAWTLGSLKYLASGGVDSITYFETAGWLGVQEIQSGSPTNDAQREAFPSTPGTVCPLYHVLADVGEFTGGELLECVSSSPLKMEALFLEHQGRQRLLLGSFVDQQQLVHIDCGRKISGARQRLLTTENEMAAIQTPEAFRGPDSTTWVAAEGETIRCTLPPHAIARLDLEDLP